MLQIERNAFHQLAPSQALLLDRRSRDLEWIESIPNVQVTQVLDLQRSAEGAAVNAFTLMFSREVPSTLQVGTTRYRRLMDTFFLPIVPDPALSTVLFDFAASIYDDLVDQGYNVAVSKFLLELVLKRHRGEARILDFGCGTGLALIAASGLSHHRVSLVGTDSSVRMLQIAKIRGEKVITTSEWADLPAGIWQGVVSTFVLHYGILDSDLALIAKQLKPGHYFAANFFKADGIAIDALRRRASNHGLSLEAVDDTFCTGESRNPILLFEKSL